MHSTELVISCNAQQTNPKQLLMIVDQVLDDTDLMYSRLISHCCQ